MNQKFAFVLAGGLTIFFLILVGSAAAMTIAALLVVPSNAQPQNAGPVSPNATNSLITQLSADRASQIALHAVPGATLVRPPELVNYQGIVAYEVVLDRGVWYVDANSGAILANSPTTQDSVPNRRREEKHIEYEHEEDADD